MAGTVDVVIVGAGHSGLAMSHFLAAHSIDHILIERGEVANSWRRERWDSLRLLTPNWLSRLPGYEYSGNDPDGYMTMNEVVEFITNYATMSSAPVRTGTTVESVAVDDYGYRVVTNRGQWSCRAVVLASGGFNIPVIPQISEAVPVGITQLTPHQYRNPRQLEDGGVLVVGASATGIQLADEIQRAGNEVTIAVGEHVRMPRNYRGRDILYWMTAAGILDQRHHEVDDIVRARAVASPQLIGSAERQSIDLNLLSSRGARVVGRLAGIRDGRAQFSGSLRNVCALADLKMNRLLATIDEWADHNEIPPGNHAGERPAPTRVPESNCLGIDLAKARIRTIIWATGFRADFSWLRIPVLDRKGRIRHDGGVVSDAPGVYVMGLPFLRRRKSSFIHGAADDAHDLSAHLAGFLRGRGAGPWGKVAI